MMVDLPKPFQKLVAELDDITRSQNFTRRIRVPKSGTHAELAEAINALLASARKREQSLLEQIDELKSSCDDAQTTNKMLRMVKDELKSRRRQLDDAVARAAAASTAKSQFLANMSHEIRTPMNGILGTAELMARTKLDDKQLKYAGTIIKSGRALLTIINDILDFSKVESGKFDLDDRPFDVIMCVNDVVSLLTPTSSRKQVGLSVSVEPSLPRWFKGDVGRLRQILTNIVGNSVKFTDRGEVKVALKSECVGGRQMLRFDIIDTGIGIPDEKINDVFEKFSQVDNTSARRHEGTGLGLAICRALIERMGGQIGLHSKLGVGSTFWFTLPLEQQSEMRSVSHQGMDINGQIVVLFEPEGVETSPLATQLRKLGCDVKVVTEIGLLPGVLDSLKSTATVVVMLNVLVSSETLLRQVAELRARPMMSPMVIAVCTSLGVSGDSKNFVEAGAQAYLSGSLSDDQLRNALSDALSNLANGSSQLVTRYSIGDERATVAQAADAATAVAIAEPAGSKKVLLVEDSLVNQEVARDFLESMGCTVDVAMNGQEAVAALNLETYAIVLMDCQMPIMDGFQATRIIREREEQGRSAPIPIVALTANAFESDREKCMMAGMSDFLSKPFMPDQFEAVVRKWLPAA